MTLLRENQEGTSKLPEWIHTLSMSALVVFVF